MLEVEFETKVLLITNRRNLLARNVFELEIEKVMLSAQNRTDEVERVQTRINDLINADAALEQMITELQTAQ